MAYTRFNAVDTRNCITQLEKCVHELNGSCVHNNDITKILGLQHVPGNVGRLTHFLLKRKPNVYKYSTLMYSDTIDSNSIEESAYFARYYLGLVGCSIIEYVSQNPGCTQSKLSTDCLGLKNDDYKDHHWIASQLLNVLQTFGLLNKYRNGYKKNARTSITLTNQRVRESCAELHEKVFRFGFETIHEYIHSKKIGSVSEQWYVRHLLNNKTDWCLRRLEIQKTFPGLVGVGNRPLRMDIFIKQGHEGGVINKCIEIDESHHTRERTLDHDDRKAAYTDRHGVTLVRIPVFKKTNTC